MMLTVKGEPEICTTNMVLGKKLNIFFSGRTIMVRVPPCPPRV